MCGGPRAIAVEADTTTTTITATTTTLHDGSLMAWGILTPKPSSQYMSLYMRREPGRQKWPGPD